MPFEIAFDGLPGGYSLTAARDGEELLIQVMEFTSTEDGQHFIERLEGTPSEILDRLRVQHNVHILPSSVDTILAIIRRDAQSTVYVNELAIAVQMRAARAVKSGDTIRKSDIVDIFRMDVGVEIPRDAGVLFLFSFGWRKGLVYDFGPLGPDKVERRTDLSELFAQAYCHVSFQERFSISDAEWEKLFAAKWFPFAGLSPGIIDSMIAYIRTGWSPDELLPSIVEEVRRRGSDISNAWKDNPSFTPHVEILSRAVEHFRNGDYMSCTGLLYPRIEGILRTHHLSLGLTQNPNFKNLTATAVCSKIGKEKCLLLPHKFEDYLRDVFFANFDPAAPQVDISRHTVSHGVAAAADFNEKSAVLGILVTHQLFYFLERPKPQDAAAAQA